MHLGDIYLPAGNGTDVGSFEFIVGSNKDGLKVEIGSIVSADTPEGVVVGAVDSIRTVGTATDPVAASVRTKHASAEAQPWSEQTMAMVANVQVFHSPALRPVVGGSVRPATADEVRIATNQNGLKWPIPAGAVKLIDGTLVPISLDGHMVFGPEGQGVNIGGRSGAAAKSSFAGFLLKSAIAAGSRTRSAETGIVKESVALFAFNVKGSDLAFMGVDAEDGFLSDEDKDVYEICGVPTGGFDNVTVFAPALPAGQPGTSSSNPDALPLRWRLTDIWPYLHHVMPDLWGNDNARLFLDEFYNLEVNNPRNKYARVDTFAKLAAWFEAHEVPKNPEDPEGPSELVWRSHHPLTLAKMRKRLMGLKSQLGGLLAEGDRCDDVPVTGLSHGQVFVIDIARLDGKVQSLIVSRITERLMRSLEADRAGVAHASVWADELNSFAPREGATDLSAVKRTFREVATQGRYAGMSLIGMAQQLSMVDELLRNNAGTLALGVTGDGELSSGIYGRLSRGVREQIVTLRPGQMMLWHYTLRAPMMVKFPRPAWRTGKPDAVATGAKPVATPARTLQLSDENFEALTGSLSEDMVTGIVNGAETREQAIELLDKAAKPDPKKNQIHAPRDVDPDNPFHLD